MLSSPPRPHMIRELLQSNRRWKNGNGNWLDVTMCLSTLLLPSNLIHPLKMFNQIWCFIFTESMKTVKWSGITCWAIYTGRDLRSLNYLSAGRQWEIPSPFSQSQASPHHYRTCAGCIKCRVLFTDLHNNSSKYHHPATANWREKVSTAFHSVLCTVLGSWVMDIYQGHLLFDLIDTKRQY